MIAPVRTAVLLALMAVCSCKALERPFPDKHLYAIDTGATEPSMGRTSAGPVLRVRPIAIASPFDDASFMYKVGESRFESDYYNNFVTAPSKLLTGELIRRADVAGQFSSVISGANIASSTLALEGNVTALYGDYTDRSSPAAVIDARFFLIRDDPAAVNILFEKSYSVREPFADDTPEALVAAWGRAYARMIDELISDLSKVTVAAR
jgi:ABC-type uncharacterized transport system auxiliary subunit